MRKKSVLTSRFLNDHAVFFGLSLADLTGVFILFVVVHKALLFWGRLEILALPIGLVSAMILSSIRYHTRRQSIRDFLWYWLRGRVYYVGPKKVFFSRNSRAL